MQLIFDSALLAYASEFAGRFAPFQGVEVAPLDPASPSGGATVTALSDHGAIGMVGFDPKGRADRTLVLRPEPALAKACRGIKSAERDVRIEGDDPAALLARVTTYYKAHSNHKDFTVSTVRDAPFPPYRQVVQSVLERWGAEPGETSTAGRYDLTLLTKAIRLMEDDASSIVISGYEGGPLRLQREDTQIVLLLMPQAAEAIPPAPDWLIRYASTSP